MTIFSRVLLLLAGLTAGSVAAWADNADAETREPADTYEIEIDGGKAVEAGPGEPATVRVGERDVKVVVRPKPLREFRAAGVSFRYPRNHAFEYEVEEASGLKMWTLDGNSCVLILYKCPPLVPPAVMAKGLVDSLQQSYGKKNVEIGKSEIELAGERIEGTRIEAMVAGTKLRQDIYVLPRPHTRGLVLAIQDSLTDDGGPTKETVEVIKLLSETFRWNEPAKAAREKKAEN